jgi:hypothetical protein
VFDSIGFYIAEDYLIHTFIEALEGELIERGGLKDAFSQYPL